MKEPKINQYETVNGKVVKVDDELIKKKEAIVKRQMSNKTNDLTLLDQDSKEIDAFLKKQDKAIDTIVNAMVLGRHFIEVSGIDQPFLTQDGADFLARATGMRVEYELIKDLVNYDQQLVLYEYKAVAYNGNIKLGEGIASANSKEEVHRKVYQELKGSVWVDRPNKTVFDVLNTVQQKAQIRAKKKVVRNILGISGQVGQDPELADNPKVTKFVSMNIYVQLYKHYLSIAPEAPAKKKQKNGKWKFFDDKEKQKWRKEWVRVNVLQPWLLAEGVPPTNWGTKDIEKIKEALPNLDYPGKTKLIETKEVQNEPKTKHD